MTYRTLSLPWARWHHSEDGDTPCTCEILVNKDPVFQTKTGWYFWSEDRLDCFGPLPSEEAANISLEAHVRSRR